VHHHAVARQRLGNRRRDLEQAAARARGLCRDERHRVERGTTVSHAPPAHQQVAAGLETIWIDGHRHAISHHLRRHRGFRQGQGLGLAEHRGAAHLAGKQ
jgi:hypothetical protein